MSDDNPFGDDNAIDFDSSNSGTDESLPPSALHSRYGSGDLSLSKSGTSVLSEKPSLPPRPAQMSPLTLQLLNIQDNSNSKPPLPLRPTLISATMASSASHQQIFHLETLNANRSVPLSFPSSEFSVSKHTITAMTFNSRFVVLAHVNFIKIYPVPPLSKMSNLNSLAFSTDSALHLSKNDIRPVSMAFLPTLSTAKATNLRPSSLIWVGYSDGELILVDCETASILDRRLTAHSHSVAHIITITKSAHVITLDDNGVMQYWSETYVPGSSRPIFANVDERLLSSEEEASESTYPEVVSLQARPKTIRIGAAQECVINVSATGQLWTCKDRSIEIISPMDTDGVLVKARFESPAFVAFISCIAEVSDGSPVDFRTSFTNTNGEELVNPFSNANALDASYASTILSPTTPSSDKYSRVYTGHTDGKIVEWNSFNYSRLRIFDTGSYRIVSLLGISERLIWCSIGTGKVFIIDIRDITNALFNAVAPPVVVKEFQAENKESIPFITIDPLSATFTPQLLLLTGTKSGHVRMYNCLFPNDQRSALLKRSQAKIFTFQEVSVTIFSWNVNAQKPSSIVLEGLLDELNSSSTTPPDILVFGIQEIVDLESTRVAAKSVLGGSTHAAKWKDAFTACITKYGSYDLILSTDMVGLFLAIYVRRDAIAKHGLSNAEIYTCGTGIGAYGNKGAVIARLIVGHSSFCFVVSHLPAHQNKVGKRNVDASTILKSEGFSMVTGVPGIPYAGIAVLQDLIFCRGGDGTSILDYENVFFWGDLNYRIDLARSDVLNHVKLGAFGELLRNDQLIKARSSTGGGGTCLLRLFDENEIDFAPTYKYDIGSDTYDSSEKQRVPAWCDRILWRDGISRCSTCYVDPSLRSSTLFPETDPRIKASGYRRFEVKTSDHRPVACEFRVRVKNCWEGSNQAIEEVLAQTRQT